VFVYRRKINNSVVEEAVERCGRCGCMLTPYSSSAFAGRSPVHDVWRRSGERGITG
jgi:hypothetical protein